MRDGPTAENSLFNWSPESPANGEKPGNLGKARRSAGEEAMSSLRTSVDSDAEPEQMETKEIKLAKQRGGGGIEGVTTDRSLGRAPACAPQVQAGGGSSRRGPASGEPSSVFGRHRQSFLFGEEIREGILRQVRRRRHIIQIMRVM